MLLTVLIWAYAQGERSSRRIERACQQDLAYRVICGGNLPDHTTIARFRAEFAEAVTELFAQVLQLCARLGMVNLATITLDGTKVRGNASMGANRGLDWLEHHAAAAVAEHAAADASEDDLFGPGRRGDAVPTDLQPDPTDTDPTDTSGGCGGGDGGGGGGALTPARARGQAGRAARIREALEQVGTAVQERTQAQQATADAYLERVRAGQKAPGRILAEQEAKLAAWHDWSPYRTHRLRGHRPKVDDYFQVVQLRAQIERLQARQPTPNTSTSTSTSTSGQGGDGQGGDGQGGDGEKTSADKADRRGPVRNITDTASRVMPTRNGFIQGYNAQNVITADGLILATRLTQCPNDVTFYQPMINEAVATAARLATHRPTTGTGTGTGTDPTQIGLVLADAGYLSTDNLTTPGPDRLIATGKHRTLLHAARDHTPPAQTDPDPTDRSLTRFRGQGGCGVQAAACARF